MFSAVVQMIMQQSKDQSALLQAQIQLAKEESKELRAELRDMRAGPKTNWIDVLKEGIKEAKGLIPELKDLFPQSEGRARGPWWAGGRTRWPGSAPRARSGWRARSQWARERRL